MNFFKSVFSDDPDPPQPESGSDNASPDKAPDPPRSSATDSGDAEVWNFGGLIKTLTSKSESIIDTYRRDLQEFGTGLRKEIEVAQGSLGTVGHVIDEFGNTVVKGTAQIISQGKDAILAVDLDSDSDNNNNNNISANRKSLDSMRYSRFDAQVRAIQGDASTYTEEPEDLNEFNDWKLGFPLEGKGEEMEGLFRENDAMESVYEKIVPNTVDHETFWYRYYYKVYKLKKAENLRARLVSGISGEDEVLSWDVEDDDDDENRGDSKPLVMNKEVGGGNVDNTQLHVVSNEGGTKRLDVEEESKVEKKLPSEEVVNKVEKSVEEPQIEKSESVGEKGGVDEASKSKVDDGVSKDDSVAESDEKVIKEREGGGEKSSGKSNEVAEIQQSANEEEDLGWDEIEDLSSIDDRKTTHSGGTDKVDLRKRLSAAEEEEDLSWDIEDDDEPAKA